MEELRSKFTLCLIGRSGSGKGVQAHFLLKRLGRRVHHMETGRFLRALVTKYKNPTTRIARANIGKGYLLPSWLAAYTWLEELIEGGKADRHFLFDGAPRRLWEAQLIDEVLRWHGRAEAFFIYLDVSEKTATSRLLSRGRKDDVRKAIKNRMNYFKREVIPVIEYYKRKKRLIRINGEDTPEEVSRRIDIELSKRLGRKWK